MNQYMSPPRRRPASVSFADRQSTVLATITPRSVMSAAERDAIWYNASELQMFKDKARYLVRKINEIELFTKGINCGERKVEIASICCCLKSGLALRCSMVPSTDASPKGDHTDHFIPSAIATADIAKEEWYGHLRGIEDRLSSTRQRNKRAVIRAVLEFQQRLKNGRTNFDSTESNSSSKNAPMDESMRIALISLKCTMWARTLALATAQADFFEAYPHLAPNDMVPNIMAAEKTADTVAPFPNLFKIRNSKRKRARDYAPFINLSLYPVVAAENSTRRSLLHKSRA